MSSLRKRVRTLEADLRATPMQHYIYSDLPFAIFCYPPPHEWLMRAEIERLKTRMEEATDREIVYVSLAELMWQAIDESEGLEVLSKMEARSGFEKTQLQIQNYLSDPDWRPLPDLLASRLDQLDPQRYIAFIVRTSALAPNIYRVSKLLDEMKGRTRVPCVLFMPATTEGQSSLRFMGIAEDEGRGSYRTKVYVN